MSNNFTLGEKEAEKCCDFYQNANVLFMFNQTGVLDEH